MNKRRFSTITLIALGFVLGGILQPFHWVQTWAQGDCRTFPETGKQVCGRFLQYWTTNGGLAQQGLPLTNEFTEISDLNGQSYTVQYFERAVFEKHPENQAPYDVLLSQLGTFRLQVKYPNGDPSGAPAPVPPTQPPAPSQSIIGQTVRYSLYSGSGGIIQATVTDVKETATLPAGSIYSALTAKGKFVLVFVDVINVGTDSTSAYFGAKLRDSKGRNFDIGDTDAQRNAAELYNVDAAQETLQPGISSKTILVFDVAPDATGYMLVGNS